MQKLLLFNFPKKHHIVQKYQKLSARYKIEVINTPLEANIYLKNNNDCIFVYFANGNIECVQINAILKKVSPSLKNKSILSIGIVNLNERKYNKIFRELGTFSLLDINTDIAQIENIINDSKLEYANLPLHSEKKTNIENTEVWKLANIPSIKDLDLESGTITLTGPQNESLILEHYDSESLEIISTKKLNIAPGEKFEFKILLEYRKCKIEIAIESTIEDLEEYDEDSVLIIVRPVNDQKDNLENFMNLYEQRQKSIHDFLQLASGRNYSENIQ